MKKLNLILALITLLALSFDSCDKIEALGKKYEIMYSCYNFAKGTVSLVYVGADGKNIVDEPLIGSFDLWQSDRMTFKKGDFVSIQAQYNGETRSDFYVKLTIRCWGCESLNGSDESLTKTLYVSNGNLVDLTGNVD